MGEAIGQSLGFAVGVAISPMPIVAVVLMLVSSRAKANGLSFLLGWLLGLAILGGIVLALAGPSDTTSDTAGPETWVSVLKLVLGLLLVLLAVRQWQGRPRDGAEPTMPKWMSAIDSFTPIKSAGVGAFLSGLNPKNLLLTVAGATAIAQTQVSGAEQVGAYVVFMLIATIGVAIPVVIYFALGPKAPELLQKLKAWMSDNNAVIMGVLFLVFGAKLIGDAISGFAS
jgi:hypothetical protein